MILVVDNYDSFVHNVARYFAVLGAATQVVRNDALDLGAVRRLRPEAILLSPGPCTPAEAGISMAIVAQLSGHVPILGVCLGHQCIGAAFGGTVAPARHPLHGQASRVAHTGERLFAGLPTPLAAGRYHSLIVESSAALDAALIVDATSQEGEIMALSHKVHPTYGVQFHPESILTEGGLDLFRNFLVLSRAWSRHVLA